MAWPAMILKRILPVCLASTVAWASPPNARAHGTGFRLLETCPGVAGALFHYSSGEPMAWVRVRIMRPGAAGEFLSTRTDPSGVVLFQPDSPGRWLIEAQDDEGHKATAEAVVTDGGPPAGELGRTGEEEPDGRKTPWPLPRQPARDSERDPPWMRAVAGASLILNLFLGLALHRMRPRER